MRGLDGTITIIVVFTLVGIFTMFYWMGNPKSAHNIAFVEYNNKCEASGGTVVNYRTSALPSSQHTCVKKDTIIEVRK